MRSPLIANLSTGAFVGLMSSHLEVQLARLRSRIFCGAEFSHRQVRRKKRGFNKGEASPALTAPIGREPENSFTTIAPGD